MIEQPKTKEEALAAINGAFVVIRGMEERILQIANDSHRDFTDSESSNEVTLYQASNALEGEDWEGLVDKYFEAS